VDDVSIEIAEVTCAQAFNVRGDPARGQFVEAVEGICGIDLPRTANTCTVSGERALLWLGPRSWLWLAGSAGLEFLSTRNAVNTAGGAAFDVSASYVMWRVAGTAAPRVLNRMCPLDLHERVFVPRSCAQTLFGHIAGMLYRPGMAPAFVLLLPRSYAQDAWHHLCTSVSTEQHAFTPAIPLHLAHSPTWQH